jgi:hypothetical protein
MKSEGSTFNRSRSTAKPKTDRVVARRYRSLDCESPAATRHFSDSLDFALSGFLVAQGCSPEEVLKKINVVRQLAANSRNEACGIQKPQNAMK